MPFYLTRDPVPSADMRNVFDNAQNLDLFLNDITSAIWTVRLGRSRMSWFGMESAFTVKLTDFESLFATQLTTQETAFDAAQADKEARFVHFLDSSGYVFLGDYEDGPFQFSTRNQYIRFQGQFFRLSKETDTGFTTTGTDETSFANDVTHLVLMDGDTLRQNLGSGEEGLGDTLVTHVQGDIFTGSVREFLNSTIQYVTPELRGYKSSNSPEDNAAAMLEALTLASANNLVCKFQNGTYNSNDIEVNFPVSVDVSPTAFLDFALVIRGGYFNAVSKVETTLDWESVPAGTTAIAGDFSSFTVGGVAAVKLQDSDGGSATVGNETGFDFSVISAKSSSSLTLTTPLRLPYRNPDVSYISNAVQFAGSMSSGDYYITGDFTSMFVAGDVLRVENIDSATGVEASKFYFEYVKIREITTDGISLKARLNYNHTNPWLVKTMFIKETTITGGGRIKRLEIRQCDSPRVQNLSIDRLIVGNCYDSTTANINSVGVSDPSTMNHSFCFGRSSVSNVRVGGSYATFDNAACKFMTCPMMQVSNVTSDNTTATGTQGDFGLFVDAFFTPYLGWNTGMSINDIKVERPRSPVNRAVWFYGMKNSTVTNVTGGEVFIQGNVSSTFMGINIPDEPLESRDLVGCVVSGLCKSSRILGCVDTDFSLKTTGLGSGYSLNIACFLGSGIKNPNTGVSYTIGSNNKVDINSLSESASAVTIYAQSQNNLLFGSGCRDKSTVASSITLGTLITNPGMQPNRLNGSIGTGSGWTGVRIKGGIAFDGNYADGYIVINGRYLWVSSDNKLKMSLTKPDADSPSGQIIIGP